MARIRGQLGRYQATGSTPKVKKIAAITVIALALSSTVAYGQSLSNGRAEIDGGFKIIYSNKTCFRDFIPERCDVYYSPRHVTWRVHWKTTLISNGIIEFYIKRGGNRFEIRNEYGKRTGVAELIPDLKLLRLIPTEELDYIWAYESIKIFDLK